MSDKIQPKNKMKDHKIDVRLTNEQYQWLEGAAKEATIGRGTLLRQKIEEWRRIDMQVKEDQAKYESYRKETNQDQLDRDYQEYLDQKYAKNS